MVDVKVIYLRRLSGQWQPIRVELLLQKHLTEKA
jgi:hypothetical protein